MKILIVEDNPDDRKVLKFNLEHHGCEVIEASDGAEGLHLANVKKPDLIVSDALMPVMDGFQFLRAVKTDEVLKDIPFIFYSAVYTGYKEAELAISIAEAFIIKPKDPEDFWEELKSILEECKLKQEKIITAELIEKDEEFLRKYSHIVATKLEEKVRELEKAKATVEAKEQEWQMTFDSIGDCITIHDRDFNMLLANKSCERILGASQNEIRSRKCFELFHGRKEPHEACPKLKTEQTGNLFETEMFEPGLNCWLSITCFPLLDKNGAVRGVVHFAKDITQRKKMEEALVESEAKFRKLSQEFNALLDAIPDNLTLQSPDLKMLWTNNSAAAGLNKKPDELIGAYCYQLWHNKVEPCEPCPVLKSFRSGEPATETVTTPDGKIWEIRTIPIIEAGRVVNVIELGRNITEHRKLEMQYLQAQKMEAVGQLAGGVAHDFNNILTAIIGYGHIALMKMAQDDPLRLNIENMLEGADRAAHLTKDLLLFSRKQVSERKPVDLNKVIRKVEKFLKRVIREDIESKIILQDRPIMALADSHQLEQVLMNFATNACDAMQTGGAFTVTTEQVHLNEDFTESHGYGKPGTYAMITVSDTGKGMDEETRTRIFEPFFTTKEVGKGTGLGLAVVYGIIKQHEGFINVYSEPGKGTTFRIYLPIIAPETRELTREHQEETPSRGTETILLAEDDESVRSLSKTVLAEFGYTVIEAVDGEDAVIKFKENKDIIQLLLFDLIMPKMSGKEAYDEIRKIKPDMKVIFASGYAPDLVLQKASLENGALLIFKPVSPMKLLRMVRSVLDITAK
jgi:PAS domain S-box-containing protein